MNVGIGIKLSEPKLICGKSNIELNLMAKTV